MYIIHDEVSTLISTSLQRNITFNDSILIDLNDFTNRNENSDELDSTHIVS